LIGVVLAAGEGSRLRPLTDAIPKTLLDVAPNVTILDVALGNLSKVGITQTFVVVGYAAKAIEDLVPTLEARHGVSVTTIFNDKASIWNNAYSLWLARDALMRDALVLNGDTVHPVSVEERVLAARGPDVLLAIDDAKVVGDEEMKVVLNEQGGLQRINKAIDPATADGEYMGVTLIEGRAVRALADALEATFTRDPGLYYEDGYQEFVDRGGEVRIVPIETKDWVEVDDHTDLERARVIACLY